MTTRAQKWGDSLGVRIPRTAIEQIGRRAGAPVRVRARTGNVIIEPDVPARCDLVSLLRRVTRANRHDEIDWGGPKGGEVW